MARCLGLLGSLSLGTGAGKTRFRRLKESLSVPKDSLDQDWKPVPFTARAEKIHPGPDGVSEILLRGVVLRLPTSTPKDCGLRAFCLHCPHELCYVNLVKETETVRVPDVPKPDNPLLVCPCHFSVFDPAADGALLTGPAGRGLYLFRFEVSENTIDIQEVEEAALG